MKIIDLNNWERADHYRFFRRMDYPQYNVCMNLEATSFLKALDRQNLSFYYAMLFAANQAVNEVEALRYRIRGDQVILHDQVHPSFTDMTPGSDLFKIVVIDMEADLKTFVARAAAKSERQTGFAIPEDIEGRDDLIYYTCLPWVTFTSLSHTISLNKDDSTPRISWGKYFHEGGQIWLPFSVQAHHSFVDGIHIGRYIDKVQAFMDGFA